MSGCFIRVKIKEKVKWNSSTQRPMCPAQPPHVVSNRIIWTTFTSLSEHEPVTLLEQTAAAVECKTTQLVSLYCMRINKLLYNSHSYVHTYICDSKQNETIQSKVLRILGHSLMWLYPVGPQTHNEDDDRNGITNANLSGLILTG